MLAREGLASSWNGAGRPAIASDELQAAAKRHQRGLDKVDPRAARTADPPALRRRRRGAGLLVEPTGASTAASGGCCAGASVAVVHAIGDALQFAFGMTWEVLWALILGFALSGAVQAVVSKRQMRRLLPDDSPRTLAVATRLGAASSSCSYAAVALARSLFRKGAELHRRDGVPVRLHEPRDRARDHPARSCSAGSSPLGEFVGGPIMIALLALLFRRFLKPQLVEEARRQADRGVLGSDGGARRDGHVRRGEGSLWRRIRSPQGFTAISHYFVMDWAAVWMDIFGGLLIAGALAAWVPELVLAGPVPRAPPRAGEDLGAADRAARGDLSASSARSATCRSPPCCGTAASASAA